jgi:SHS family lactate transporter-like MFS transporter
MTPYFAWRKDVSRQQWRAFIAAYLGWMLVGFDFTILTFLLSDIARTFTVNSALAGALGTVTLMFRLVGGMWGGSAADRWGRKVPLILSILWYSAFAFLSGFSTSYGVLFTLRALFGIGMGGVWATGMPLAIEHWPAHLRGRVSGMAQSGWPAGFILSALLFQLVYPLVSHRVDFGWRVMLWAGVLPALSIPWIIRRVDESPIWLARQQEQRAAAEPSTTPLRRLLQPDLLSTTLHASLVMAAFLLSYYAITFWYPTFIARTGRATLPFLVSFNVGAILGNLAWGQASESRMGRRGAATIAALGGIAAIPLFVFVTQSVPLAIGAFLMGFFGGSTFGIVPTYLNERFPTAARAAGAGFSYHVGAAAASVMPFIIGAFQDRGVALASAMAGSIAVTGLLSIALLWLGPETRGNTLTAERMEK